ncbi:unnamed protein product [Camellia sinensis]
MSINRQREQEMPSRFRLQSHSEPLTPTPEEGMDPPGQEVGTQPLPPHNVQPEHEVTASSSDQFDLQGNPSDVARTLNTQFGRQLSSFTYRLHKQYKQLKDARGEEYARSHPPASVTLNQWTSLIDKKWNSKEFMEQSLTNVNNRMQMKTKHR